MYAKTRKETFIDMVLSGRAEPSDIHSFVAGWHRSTDRRSLPSALGFTREEYARWVADPTALNHILQDHVPSGVLELLEIAS